jgi:uroporphyrinogen-III synthase
MYNRKAAGSVTSLSCASPLPPEVRYEGTVYTSWAITRAEPALSEDVQWLHARRIAAVGVPAIEVLFRAFQWPQVSRCLAVVTSSAVAHRIPFSAQNEMCVAALTPVTSGILRSRGFDVIAESNGGVLELASHLSKQYSRSGFQVVWYPTSDAARAQTTHTQVCHELEKVAPLMCETVYSVRDYGTLRAGLSELKTPWGLVVFSPSAVEACERAVLLHTPSAVVAVGRSTQARSLQVAGWPQPHLISPASNWREAFAEWISA